MLLFVCKFKILIKKYFILDFFRKFLQLVGFFIDVVENLYSNAFVVINLGLMIIHSTKAFRGFIRFHFDYPSAMLLACVENTSCYMTRCLKMLSKDCFIWCPCLQSCKFRYVSLFLLVLSTLYKNHVSSTIPFKLLLTLL